MTKKRVSEGIPLVPNWEKSNDELIRVRKSIGELLLSLQTPMYSSFLPIQFGINKNKVRY